MFESIQQKIYIVIMALATVCLFPNITLGQSTGYGLIQFNNNVKVNGERAHSASTIFSGNEIVTGLDSDAIVSFGSKGSVKLLPETSAILKVSENGFSVDLNSGRIQVISAPKTRVTVVTQSATVTTEAGITNSFWVDTGCSDKSCQMTNAEVNSGQLKMISTRNQKSQNIPAGSNKSSRLLYDDCSKACMRPGTAKPVLIAPKGAFIPVLIAIGSAALAALLLSRNNNQGDIGGEATTVSPMF